MKVWDDIKVWLNHELHRLQREIADLDSRTALLMKQISPPGLRYAITQSVEKMNQSLLHSCKVVNDLIALGENVIKLGLRQYLP